MNLDWFRLGYEVFASPSRGYFLRECFRTEEEWEEAQVWARVVETLDAMNPDLFQELFERAFPHAP